MLTLEVDLRLLLSIASHGKYLPRVFTFTLLKYRSRFINIIYLLYTTPKVKSSHKHKLLKKPDYSHLVQTE